MLLGRAVAQDVYPVILDWLDSHAGVPIDRGVETAPIEGDRGVGDKADADATEETRPAKKSASTAA